MESNPRLAFFRQRGWAAGLLLCLAAGAGTMQAQGRGSATPVSNEVRDLRAVGPFVEIELHSSREFPVRNEVVSIRIGNTEFTRSRYPDDGRLDTLIFMLTPAEFDQAPDGQTMTVQYGKRPAKGLQWNFGRLKKSSLRR